MNYTDIVKSMPYGLERSLLRRLASQPGRTNMITREDLLSEIKKNPGMSEVDDRKMRMAIQNLRAVGVRICHDETRLHGRMVYGYYLAETEEEYATFRSRYCSYAKTIFDTVKAMDEGKVVNRSGDITPPAEMAIQERLI
jgi:hypothetical protein